MSMSRGPDASNASLPAGSPVVVSVPPVPSTTRGEPVHLDGQCGRLNSGKALLAYGSKKSVVVRMLGSDEGILPGTESKLPVLVYRGHQAQVTSVKMAPSGAYCASGDERGKLRVWAFDHEEHLCKFDGPGLGGPIKDVSWDGESKRIAMAGGVDAKAECARVVQWDTGVTVGQLSQHLKGRAASVTMKPQRPFRLVTAGAEDHKCIFHKGPPFQRVPPENGVPSELAHIKGAVNCIRYTPDGSLIASVGSDKSICIYDGKTMELKSRLDNIHKLTVYSAAWSADAKNIITASGDGTCKLFDVSSDGKLSEKHTWKVAENQLGKSYDRVPVGGGQLGCAFISGNQPVSVGLNGQLSMLPMPGTSGKISVVTSHTAPIDGVSVDHRNGVFYTGDSDGLLCKWDLKTGQPKHRLEHPEGNGDLMYVVHGGAVSCLTVLGDGTLLSFGWDDKMFVTDKAGKVQANPVALGAQPNAVASGNQLAVILTVEGILLSKGGNLSSTGIISLGYTAQAVVVSKDDKLVYVGGDDCKIHVYDTDGSSLNEKHVIENGHLKPIYAMALSNDGLKLASADVRDVCVWDLKDGYKPLIGKGRWCFHVQRITCLSWSPDDKIIASGGLDDSIYLWSLEKKMKRIHYKYAHRGGLTGIEFLKSGPGVRFVSVGADSCVNQWDVAEDIKAKFG